MRYRGVGDCLSADGTRSFAADAVGDTAEVRGRRGNVLRERPDCGAEDAGALLKSGVGVGILILVLGCLVDDAGEVVA